jgi:murein DD-endopeptidase MepM/ murein hydrolase activator NlpD
MMKYSIVWVLLLMILWWGISNAVDTTYGDTSDTSLDVIDGLTQELFALDQQERSEEGISEKYREVRNEIVNVINTIQANTEQIDVMMRRVATYKQNIDSTAHTIKELRNEMEETRGYLEEFALFLYQTSNYISDPEKWSIDEIKLLVHSDNIPRTLANEQIVEWMIYQFNDLLEKLSHSEDKHLEAIVKMNQLRASAKQDILTYSSELEKMQQKRLYLTQFIELYRNGSLQTNGIGGVFENKRSVHDAILTMVDEIQKKKYNVPFNIFEKIKELDAMQSDHPYEISWPIYPIEQIETFFDDEDFRENNGFPHRAIQIKATQGTPVYTARDGIVYHVTNNDNIGINRILVLHNNGYVSAYTYVNRVLVQEWDVVSRGQLLGYSGGEPGTRWAWFMSPGSNLTFAVFHNASPVDPLKILDTSVVKDKDILPDVYAIKYLRDKYARKIDITTLPVVEGMSVDERAQNFLASYGVWVYKTLSFRENAVKDTNIDRDMVACVAFAESTLGRYLSTNGNIGNVGNNDRWDRFAFGSALAGARAIAQTLNNQYLGDYHTIDQLSRYGNSDGNIYASSPVNRQTNVLKCLSQIKGYYIPEDFPFRTWVNPNKIPEQSISGEFDWEQVRVGQGE